MKTMKTSVEAIESAHAFSDLSPIAYQHANRRVRLVLDGVTTTDRLAALPISRSVSTLIAEAIQEGQRSATDWGYRERFGEPIRPLAWYLD